MFTRILQLILPFLSVFSLSAQEIQNTSNTWYFGNRAGLDFNTSPPTALSDGQLNTQEGVATVSNNNGELLFYTDGITVWDRTHQPMPGGDGTLDGHWSSTQSAVIVPNLSNPNLYYIFTTDELGGNNGLSYTTIDMTLPGNGSVGSPLGDVINGELNIQLVTPVTEKITAVLKPDYKGYWVVAHGWNNNRFYTYEVTCEGINTNPVVSDVGNIHSGGIGNINAVGYMKASIIGQNLALVNRSTGTIDLFDFDNSSGIVSNPIEILPNDPLIYGIEFSPSGNYLYIGGKNVISRYTMGIGILTDISIDMPSALNDFNVIRALQLGPDENIYVSVRGLQYISAIYNPDGNDPVLTVNAIFLNPDGVGRNCRFGLPNIFYFDFFPPDTISLITCPNSQVEFNGEFFTAGSINQLHFIDDDGCDSTLILMVEMYNSSAEVLEVEACAGGYYDYNGNQIPSGTEESFVYPDVNGCDSTVTVVVGILETSAEVLEFEACAGGYYDYNGNQIPSGTHESFVYPDVNGCDSIVTVIVGILETSAEVLEVEACAGGYYDYNGNQIPSGTHESFVYPDVNGCDSIVTVIVGELETNAEVLEVEACAGGYYDYNGNQIPSGTEESFVYPDVNGCDSTVTVVVGISDIVEENIYVETCEGEFYIFEGVAVEAGSEAQISSTDPNGCEILINLFVEALPLDQSQITITNCSDTTFVYSGTSIEIGDQETFTFQNQHGCDSLVTVQVVSFSDTTTIEVSICQGEYYLFNDIEYPIGTDTFFNFVGQYGCDSIVSLNVELNPVTDFSLAVKESCWNSDNGSINIESISGGLSPYEFSLNGIDFSSQSSFGNLAPGIYNFMVRDANQCIFEKVIEIEEIPEIIIYDIYPTILPCDVDSILLVIELLNGETDDLNWEWFDGSNKNQIFISQPGNYNLKISNQCQTITKEITIQTDEDIFRDLIYIPNAFSPNFDGVNDEFQLFPANDVEILNFEINIFNRWGALLFKSTDIDFSWDGLFHDRELNPDTYAWWLKATLSSCKREVQIFKKGDITILR